MPRRTAPFRCGTVLFAALGLQTPDGHAMSRGDTTAMTPLQGVSKTIRFSHRDEHLLATGQTQSSVAYLPRADLPSNAEPLLVLLHGVNESRTMYPWFGGTHDLRPTLKTLAGSAKRGFVVAAPTQTRNAWLPGNLWGGFDLGTFVTDLRSALPPGHDIDLRSVYVAGHSGAGCNPRGGLVTSTESAGGVDVAGLIFIDTCFDVAVARQLSHHPRPFPIWVMWQTVTWPRDPVPFLAQWSLSDGQTPQLTELAPRSANPHVGAMFTGLELVVRQWLLGSPSGNYAPQRPAAQSSPHPDDDPLP